MPFLTSFSSGCATSSGALRCGAVHGASSARYPPSALCCCSGQPLPEKAHASPREFGLDSEAVRSRLQASTAAETHGEHFSANFPAHLHASRETASRRPQMFHHNLPYPYLYHISAIQEPRTTARRVPPTLFARPGRVASEKKKMHEKSGWADCSGCRVSGSAPGFSSLQATLGILESALSATDPYCLFGTLRNSQLGNVRHRAPGRPSLMCPARFPLQFRLRAPPPAETMASVLTLRLAPP